MTAMSMSPADVAARLEDARTDAADKLAALEYLRNDPTATNKQVNDARNASFAASNTVVDLLHDFDVATRSHETSVFDMEVQATANAYSVLPSLIYRDLGQAKDAVFDEAMSLDRMEQVERALAEANTRKGQAHEAFQTLNNDDSLYMATEAARDLLTDAAEELLHVKVIWSRLDRYRRLGDQVREVSGAPEAAVQAMCTVDPDYRSAATDRYVLDLAALYKMENAS